MSIEFTIRGDQSYVRAYGGVAPIQRMGTRLPNAAKHDDWTTERII